MRRLVPTVVLVSAIAGCVRTATHFPLIQPRRIVSGCLTRDDGLPRPWTRVTLLVNREPVAAMLTDMFGRYRFDIPWTEQWEVRTGEAGSGPDTAPPAPPKVWTARPGEAVR